MNSQRAREARIVKKLGSGALYPASSSEAVAVMSSLGPKLSATSQCHGCDELEVDALVGDQPWHHLCLLFWQGRSDTVRG